MSSTEDKKRWKKEAQQLQSDLKNRKKSVQKREVAIKFPNKSQPATSPESPTPSPNANTKKSPRSTPNAWY